MTEDPFLVFFSQLICIGKRAIVNFKQFLEPALFSFIS